MIWNHLTLFYNFQKLGNSFSLKTISPFFLTSLGNLFKTNGLWAFSFLFLFFSIAGIPPFSGFLAKIFILFGLIESNQLVGAIFLILISAISVFYYIRVVKIVFFESKELQDNTEQFQTTFNTGFFNCDYLIISCSLFLLIFLFFWNKYLCLDRYPK